MAGLFGTTIKAGKPQYSGLQLQTSAANIPVSIVWGRNRIAPNIIWYGDFQAVKKKQKSGKGGVTTEYYEYYASVCFGLSEGPIVGVGRYWRDQSQFDWSSGDNPFTLFYGTDPQTPWGYLTSNHPEAALSYATVSYAAVANYNLGQQASLGQHSFEVLGLEQGTASNGVDADPAVVVDQFLTSDQFGATFPATGVDYTQIYSTPAAYTTGDSCFQTYCTARGLGLSPILVQQEQAMNILDRWAQLTNCAVVWDGDKLKLIPYGDEVVSGNGVTFLPPIGVVASLGYNDFVGDSGADPITLTRSDPAEAYNSFKIEIRDRNFEYNNTIVEWKDQNLIEMFGLREQSNMRADEITEKAMASEVVSLLGQRLAYIRNMYEFKLGQNFVFLLPMDIVLASDPAMGDVFLRVVGVEEDDEGVLTVTAEEFNEGVGSSNGFSTQPNDGGGQNQAVVPGPVNEPVIWEPPVSLTNGVNQVWAAISGGNGTTADPYWGGAFIYLSTDGVTYTQIGTVTEASTMGVLTSLLAAYTGANPDTVHTMAVDVGQSGITLEGATPLEAQNDGTLSYVGDEYLSYENVTLTGNFEYDIENLYRGLYGSSATNHAAGTKFVRCNEALFKYNLPPGYIGNPLYIKCQSINIWGTVFQDLADCVVYTYTPTGGGVPDAPTSLVATGGFQMITLSWTASVTPGVTEYQIWAYNGTTTDFSLATLLATVSANGYLHVGLPTADTWTYWVKAVSIGGASAPTSPVTATTS